MEGLTALHAMLGTGIAAVTLGGFIFRAGGAIRELQSSLDDAKRRLGKVEDGQKNGTHDVQQDGRLDRLEERLGRGDDRFKAMDEKMDAMRNELHEVRSTVIRIEAILESEGRKRGSTVL